MSHPCVKARAPKFSSSPIKMKVSTGQKDFFHERRVRKDEARADEGCISPDNKQPSLALQPSTVSFIGYLRMAPTRMIPYSANSASHMHGPTDSSQGCLSFFEFGFCGLTGGVTKDSFLGRRQGVVLPQYIVPAFRKSSVGVDLHVVGFSPATAAGHIGQTRVRTSPTR